MVKRSQNQNRKSNRSDRKERSQQQSVAAKGLEVRSHLPFVNPMSSLHSVSARCRFASRTWQKRVIDRQLHSGRTWARRIGLDWQSAALSADLPTNGKQGMRKQSLQALNPSASLREIGSRTGPSRPRPTPKVFGVRSQAAVGWGPGTASGLSAWSDCFPQTSRVLI